MYQNCCRKCGSTSLHTEVKGNNTGLYCDDCGAWQRWLGKDELRAFEYSMREATKEEEDSVNRYIEIISKSTGVNFYDKEDDVPKTSCDIPMPEVVECYKPKTIARIKLCGAMIFTVTERMSWEKPTEEQIKNLHDMLCIDIEILEDGE